MDVRKTRLNILSHIAADVWFRTQPKVNQPDKHINEISKYLHTSSHEVSKKYIEVVFNKLLCNTVVTDETNVIAITPTLQMVTKHSSLMLPWNTDIEINPTTCTLEVWNGLGNGYKFYFDEDYLRLVQL